MTFFKELFKSLPRTITKYPVVQKGFHFGDFASKQALKATVWIAPASIIAAWVIYPALTPKFKADIGIGPELPDNTVYNYETEELGGVPVRV